MIDVSSVHAAINNVRQAVLNMTAERPTNVHPVLEHGAALLDALCYIDTEYNDPQTQSRVDQLIEEEMRRFKPRDYLASRPMPELKTDHSVFLGIEMERLAQGKKMQPLDESRYTPKPPADSMKGDIHSWKQALTNARAQAEHLSNRTVNMELLQNYAQQVWLTYNAELEGYKGSVEKEIQAVKKQAEHVNLLRKTQQDSVEGRIRTMTFKRAMTMDQNLELQKACAVVAVEVKRLRTDVRKLGLEDAAATPMEEAE